MDGGHLNTPPRQDEPCASCLMHIVARLIIDSIVIVVVVVVVIVSTVIITCDGHTGLHVHSDAFPSITLWRVNIIDSFVIVVVVVVVVVVVSTVIITCDCHTGLRVRSDASPHIGRFVTDCCTSSTACSGLPSTMGVERCSSRTMPACFLTLGLVCHP